MSSLLELAADFEKQSKLMAASTSNSVAAVALQHEQTLREALRLSAESLKNDISQNQTEIRRALRSSLIVWLAVSLLGLAITSSLAWHIKNQMIDIVEQSDTIAAMEAKTGGAVIQQTSNGAYLVLKKGSDTGIYTTDNGQPAIRLTKRGR